MDCATTSIAIFGKGGFLASGFTDSTVGLWKVFYWILFNDDCKI